jgi:diguanylate cyclase (GGDEF)-like protein
VTRAFEATAAFDDAPPAAATALRRQNSWHACAGMLLLAVGVATGTALDLAGRSPAPVLLLLAGAAYFAWWPTRASRSRRAGIDRCTGLYERASLLETAQATCDQLRTQPFSIVVLDFSELREVHDIYGAAVTRKLIDKVVRRVEMLAGRSALAGRTGTSQFTVVLPGMREDKAVRTLARVLGKPARVEFDAGDSEIVLVPEVIVDGSDPGEQTVEALHRIMCRELTQRQNAELLRQSYLTRERERHSRPMSLPSR